MAHRNRLGAFLRTVRRWFESQHKVLIELVDAAHHVFPGQERTVTFTVPGPGK